MILSSSFKKRDMKDTRFHLVDYDIYSTCIWIVILHETKVKW